MNTQISSKLAALCMALMMNGLMVGGIAYLFSGHIQSQPLDDTRPGERLNGPPKRSARLPC